MSVSAAARRIQALEALGAGELFDAVYTFNQEYYERTGRFAYIVRFKPVTAETWRPNVRYLTRAQIDRCGRRGR